MVVSAGRSSLRGGGETLPRPREAAEGASLGAAGHGDLTQIADRGGPSGSGGWRGLRTLCPREPGRAAEAGDTEGDARAGPTAQGRGGQDQRISAGHSAGGSGHAGKRGLEEELDGWRREISVRLFSRARVRRDLSPQARRGVWTEMPGPGLPESWEPLRGEHVPPPPPTLL